MYKGWKRDDDARTHQMDEGAPEFARAFRRLSGAVFQWADGWLVERAIWPDSEEEDCAGWTLTQDEYNEMMADYERRRLEHWEAHDG